MLDILSSAHASAPTGASEAGFQIMQFAPFIAVFAIMYFLIIRPQNKRAKEMKAMIDSLKKGDRVVTSGGLIGQITKIVDENEVLVQLAEGIEVRAVRSSVAQVISKTTPKDKPTDEDDSPVRKAMLAKKNKK